MTRGKHSNNSANAGKQPYMRDDFWAKGHYDWLWEKYKDQPMVLARLDRIKEEAFHSKTNAYILPNNHYPKSQL